MFEPAPLHRVDPWNRQQIERRRGRPSKQIRPNVSIDIRKDLIAILRQLLKEQRGW
ncbi:MAG: hypothetical protein IT174_10595 [Acidobacteria bacterium]|nr:hypothetical protein [Acidobacteriota bacterium]